MVSSKKPLIQVVLILFAYGLSITPVWSAPRPPDLPNPPPLPESLKGPPPTPPPNLPDPSELYAQLQQLGDLLSMPPEKLAKLRQTVEFIEKMSPDEREAMRIRISQITESTPELKKEITTLAARFPSLERSDLSQFWHAASVDERESVRRQLQQLENPDQTTFLKGKVDAFVQRREQVFQNMRRALEEKRQNQFKD